MEPTPTPSPSDIPPVTSVPERPLVVVTHAVYTLQAVGLLLPITWIVAVVINYIKRDDAAGTFLASHFRWQIRTFWFGLLWACLGMLTFLIVIGWLIFVVAAIWIIYRIAKGWLNLVDGKAMYTEIGNR